jgi:hypothetical protein
MAVSQSFDDDVTLRAYADAHREAVAAAGLVQGWVPKETWARVITAMRRADDDLARCDDAWLDLRTAYLEMMAENGSPDRMRREQWGESITTACRYRGPADETVTRMREAARAVARHCGPREARRTERAIRRRQAEAERSGRTGAATSKAAWRLAERYRDLQIADALSVAMTNMVRDLRGDDERPWAARRGSYLCLDVGDVETARALYEIYRTAETARLAGQDDPTARLRIADMGQHLADLHLLNGEATRAEPLLRTALESVENLRDTARDHHEAAAVHAVRDECLSVLGDCLFVLRRRPEARAVYRTAHSALAHIERPTLQEIQEANRLRNAIIYTGREWRTRGAGR